jgi:Carboxypeptidase regulatory-like domain/TonB dependent receptor
MMTFQTRFARSVSWASAVTILLGLLICLGLSAHRAAAQTAGEGTISGLVTDPTGAVIPKAKVTAINAATKITTTRFSTSAGYFNVSPLPPGDYTVEVAAPGFKSLLQQNVAVNAMQTVTINAVLTVGAESQTITVTTAPPPLETENATLGMVMENSNYSNLPILMGGQQRDPTAFALLTPGAQSANNGGRMPIVGGTGSYLGQLYVDGMPAETVTQQGDNRLVSLTMDLDAIDQFQLVTSSPPAEYMGAGAENFTIKAGGLKYHGQVSDFVRNTVFDAWGFTAPWSQTKNALGQTVYAPKPVEHQNEFSVSAGGVVPHTAHKLFFYAAYLKYHYRNVRTPALYTIPSLLMRTGDFTELGTGAVPGTGLTGEALTGTGANPPFLWDPTSNACVGAVCTRQPFHAMKNLQQTYNIIPSNAISPIANYMQSFLPTPTNTGSISNNYLGTAPGGYDNHVLDWRVDYDMSSKHRLFSEGMMGTQNYVNNYSGPYINSDSGVPTPYMGGDLAHIYPKDFVMGDTYTITPNLVNQLKASFTRFFQNIQDPTQNVPGWGPSSIGMTNIPLGQAGQEFPGASFGTTSAFGTAQQTWTSNGSSISTQLTTPNNYAFTDNVKWLKGKHSFTFGFTFEFQQDNNANPATYSSVLDFAYNAYSTANYTTGTSALTTGGATTPSGYAYASYLLGAVGGSPTLGLQPLSETGGRFKPMAPYGEDIYKITRKLTLDLGLRWDYLPPFHEVKNRWTFLNPTLTNPLTNTPGMLQFAGNYGGAGVSCNCTTPVNTYWKNWGPRVSLAYEMNPKTVFRAGFAQVFTQGGGVGGRGGAANGTGGTGFNMTAIGPTEVTSGLAAGPSFYLNNSAYFTGGGYFGGSSIANTSLFGAGYVYPTPPTPSVSAEELNTGFFLCPVSGIGPGGNACTAGKMVSASSVAYADPYISGRAPTIEMFNAGFQRAITPNLTLAIDYMGNESHFIINSGTNGSNARGYWVNQLDPKYLAVLGAVKDSTNTKPILLSAATAANATIVQSYFPSAPAPAFFTSAAAVNTAATVAQMLVAFPQYTTVSDTWGTNVGNFSYHSLQFTLNQRVSHGLTFNLNYTFSKNIGDDGSFRSGYPIPQNAMSLGTKAWGQDRYERSWTDVSIPNSIHAYGVYDLPFANGNQPFILKTVLGGWKFSSIFTYSTGTPALVTWGGCSSTNYPGQGQCMPDKNPQYGRSTARINGKYGSGPNGYTVCNLGINAIGQSGCAPIVYWDTNAFQTPTSISTVSGSPQYLLGNAPRSAPLKLRSPNTWDWDAGLRKTFTIHKDVAFQFEANVSNVWNHVTFGGPGGSWGAATYGTITGVTSSPAPRDFQFAGHLKF